MRPAQLWQDFHQARASIARLGDILNTAPEPMFDPLRAALPAIKGEVTFDPVSFCYWPKISLALHDIMLKVVPGQCATIASASASSTPLDPLRMAASPLQEVISERRCQRMSDALHPGVPTLQHSHDGLRGKEIYRAADRSLARVFFAQGRCKPVARP